MSCELLRSTMAEPSGRVTSEVRRCERATTVSPAVWLRSVCWCQITSDSTAIALPGKQAATPPEAVAGVEVGPVIGKEVAQIVVGDLLHLLAEAAHLVGRDSVLPIFPEQLAN